MPVTRERGAGGRPAPVPRGQRLLATGQRPAPREHSPPPAEQLTAHLLRRSAAYQLHALANLLHSDQDTGFPGGLHGPGRVPCLPPGGPSTATCCDVVRACSPPKDFRVISREGAGAVVGMSWLGAVPGLPPGSPSVLNSQRCSPASQPSWLRARPTERRLRLAHGAPLSEVASGTTPFPRPLQSPFTPRHTSLRLPSRKGGQRSQRRRRGLLSSEACSLHQPETRSTDLLGNPQRQLSDTATFWREDHTCLKLRSNNTKEVHRRENNLSPQDAPPWS